jgi:hypothetical protein
MEPRRQAGLFALIDRKQGGPTTPWLSSPPAIEIQSERPQDLRVDLADLQTLLARTDRLERVEVPIVFLWMKGIRPPFNRQRPTAQIGQLAGCLKQGSKGS